MTLWNEENLKLGRHVRKVEGESHVLLNPTGAMWTTNPMNLGAFDCDDRLLFVLPVDHKRLTLVDITESGKELFRSTWQNFNDAVSQDPKSSAPIWNPGSEVGRPFSGAVGSWIEYQKTRPWLEVGRIAESQALLVVMETNPPMKWDENGPNQYVCRVWESELTAYSDQTLLECHDGYPNVAHFAVLDPSHEEWTQVGELSLQGLKRVRECFHGWPQRATDGSVRLR